MLTHRKSDWFVANVLIIDMHRQRLPDQFDRAHQGRIVRAKASSSDRFALDLIHTGLDAIRG